MGRTKAEKENLLREKSMKLVAIIKQVAPIYMAPGNTEDQKNYMETIIGAAIWYLPSNYEEMWTRRISVEALTKYLPSRGPKPKRLSEDHEYPRKLSAAEALTQEWGDGESAVDNFVKIYKTKYGRFNYVTPHENRVLMRLQRKSVYVDAETAYQKAGIRLVSVDFDDLKKVKKRNEEVINKYLSQAT